MPAPPTLTNQPADQAWVEILEQPSSKSTRFRYECEARSGGSLLGRTATAEHKTYPAIKVHNHNGNCVVVVSLVTTDDKPKPHPHALVGPDCRQDVCTKKVKSNLEFIQFTNLGIQCKKKKDLEAALKLRQQIRVDPFRTGFDHMKKPQINDIDLTAVKLCFQVFLPDATGKYQKALKPICSNPIYDKKVASELIINSYVPPSCRIKGGDDMILLTGKLPKDVEVRFYEGPADKPLWEEVVTPPTKDIHCGVAIKIKIPPYTGTRGRKALCSIQLRRKEKHSDTSTPVRFQYIPDDGLSQDIPRKRKSALEGVNSSKHMKTDEPEYVPDTLAQFSIDSSAFGSNSLSSTGSLPLPALMAQSEGNIPVEMQAGADQSSKNTLPPHMLHQQQNQYSTPYQSYQPNQPGFSQAGNLQQPYQQHYHQQHQQHQQYHSPPHQHMHPQISGTDAWIPVKASEVTFIKSEAGGYAVACGPGGAKQTETATAIQLDDFQFSEEQMESLIRQQQEDPNSELFFPSCMSDMLKDMGINISSESLKDLQLVNQVNEMDTGAPPDSSQ